MLSNLGLVAGFFETQSVVVVCPRTSKTMMVSAADGVLDLFGLHARPVFGIGMGDTDEGAGCVDETHVEDLRSSSRLFEVDMAATNCCEASRHGGVELANCGPSFDRRRPFFPSTILLVALCLLQGCRVDPSSCTIL